MARTRKGYSREMARKLLSQVVLLKPPVDVYAIAEGQSLTVTEIHVDDTRWSGSFYRSRKTIAVNAKHHVNRRRFTVAHELGHFCLGHESADDDFQDQAGFEGSYETGIIGADDEDIDVEREANEFASELLVPLALIKKDYASLPIPKELAKMYLVSETAMFVSLLKHRIFK